MTVFSPCLWKWWVSQCSRGCKPLPGDSSCRRKAEPAPCTCCNVFCFRMLSLDRATHTASVHSVWIYCMILHSHIPLPFSTTHFLPWIVFFFFYAFLGCKNSSPCLRPLPLPYPTFCRCFCVLSGTSNSTIRKTNSNSSRRQIIWNNRNVSAAGIGPKGMEIFVWCYKRYGHMKLVLEINEWIYVKKSVIVYFRLITKNTTALKKCGPILLLNEFHLLLISK